jgi:hypothetical protein
MAYWSTKVLYANTSESLVITASDSVKGDLFTGKTLTDRTGGVHFLTKGSVKVYNPNMDLLATFGVGDRFGSVVEGDLADGQINMATSEDATFYCISDNTRTYEWDGELISLAASESRVLTGVLGKKVLLTEEGMTLDGVAYDKNTVLSISSKNSVTVTCGSKSAVIPVIFKVV